MEPSGFQEVFDDRRREVQIADGMKNSAMEKYHAEMLAKHILHLFSSKSTLAGSGVEQTWKLGSHDHTKLNKKQWKAFQEALFDSWAEFVDNNTDEFWDSHLPTLHAFDYGQDIKIITDNVNDPVSHLAGQLKAVYNITGAASFSCAIAANLKYIRSLDDENECILALLGNRECIEDEYPTQADRRGFQFFPLGLSPRAGNFQARKPLRLLMEEVFDEMIAKTAAENSNRKVVRPGPMQGYSLLKQAVRHSPEVFSLSKAYYTAGLCLDRNKGTQKNLNKRALILQRINAKGSQYARPISREIQQTKNAVLQENIGYRFENIINFDIASMDYGNRSFDYIVSSGMLPLMRFWGSRVEDYGSLLYAFMPNVSNPE